MSEPKNNLNFQLAYEVSTAIRTLQTTIQRIEGMDTESNPLKPIEICLLLADTLDRLKKAEHHFRDATR